MVARGACVVTPGGGGRAWLLRGGHAWDMTRYGYTINERAVRILLECILVDLCISNLDLQRYLLLTLMVQNYCVASTCH